MAYPRKTYGKRKRPKKSPFESKKMINAALRAKGKGSVKRAWNMAKSAAKKGQIGLAVSLGNIAKSKASYASRKKR